MDQFSLLRLFQTISEKGSLSGAARAMGVSPSTVSEGLRQLEEQLGARLLLRSTRHMSLTPEGERFLADSRRIVADLDEAMTALCDSGPLRGEIRITSLIDFGRTRLEPLLTRFMDAHPEIRMTLTLSDRVADLVDEGFDLGFRTGPLPDSGLWAQLLLRGRRLVCASPAYWREHGRPEHPRDLARHDCLVLTRPGARVNQWQFREGRRAFAVRVTGNRSSNDGSILRKWAVEGRGVVLKSEFDIAEELAAGSIEPVLENFTEDETNLYAVRRAERKATRRVAALIDFLRDELNGDPIFASGRPHRLRPDTGA